MIKLIMVIMFLLVIMVGIFFLIYKVISATPPKKVLNYELRFSPSKKKYYIVNSLDSEDVECKNWYGGIIYFKDKVEASLVLERMKGS